MILDFQDIVLNSLILDFWAIPSSKNPRTLRKAHGKLSEPFYMKKYIILQLKFPPFLALTFIPLNPIEILPQFFL